MNFQYSGRVQDLRNRLNAFMSRHVHPAETGMNAWKRDTENPWTTPPIIRDLKEKARAEGLWNLFLPKAHYRPAPGETEPLSNLEYAPLAEIMGRVIWAPEVFNCNAPDTGNMETLILYGSGP
ncbi:MAG: acyl-CoA dehydrogenase, partial [Gammaproteobacteria bacterium]|nr:acyl-CoA dehydrogenase [Gammaproteobacteria bacterium]